MSKKEDDIIANYLKKIKLLNQYNKFYYDKDSPVISDELYDGLKKEIIKPTKIYSNEILKLTNKNLINASAHITGGGLVENLLRSTQINLLI